MQNNKIIKVAQIGVGYWGPNLLRNLQTSKNCKVEMVCDFSNERLEFVSKNYPTTRTTNKIDDILSDQSIDAVVIATPAGTHYEIALRALNAGKHILVEKPMATKYEQVAEIGKLAKARNLVAMSGHTFIYNSNVRYLKKLIESNELGEIRYIYCQRLNLGRIRSDINVLWNLAPHDISIIQYLINDLPHDSLSYQGMDYIQDGIDDVAFLSIKYPNKILANIHVSWLDPNRTRTVIVVGSKKMAVYDDASDNKITIYDKGIEPIAKLGNKMDYDTLGNIEFKHRSGDILIPQVEQQEPLKVEIEHFIDCIKGNSVCLTGIEHTLNVINILEQASSPINVNMEKVQSSSTQKTSSLSASNKDREMQKQH